MQVVIGYWSIRGLAAPLRMMCEYSGVPYTNKEYALAVKDDGRLNF
jgi:hypothetical protein